MNTVAAALRAAVSAAGLSLMVMLVAAGVVLTTLLTSGRTVALERSVLKGIDNTLLTTITVIDDQGDADLDRQFADTVDGLGTVSWALGLGPVEDVRPAGLPGAVPVAARRFLGSSRELLVRDDLDRLAGSLSEPVAVVGQEAGVATGIIEGAGAMESFDGVQVPVVGRFGTGPSTQTLDGIVLIHDPQFQGPIRRLIVRVDRPEDVEVTAAALRELVAGSGVTVQVDDKVAQVRAAVRGQLGGAGRTGVLQTLGAGLALAGLVIYSSLHARRRDTGRRRVLGATRSQIVTIVVLQVIVAALPGVVMGSAVGALATWRVTGSTPGLGYPAAVGVLTLLTIGLAALVPAVVAATRDPVLALRVP